MDKIDQQYLNEIVGGQEAGDDDSQNDLKVHEENTTIEELEVCGGRGDFRCIILLYPCEKASVLFKVT